MSVRSSLSEGPLSQILKTLLIISILIIGANIFLSCIVGISSQEAWSGIYTVEGLVLDAIGAVIVLSGDVSALRQFFIPTERIKRLEGAWEELLQTESLNQSDNGFEELVSLVREHTEIDEEVLRFEIAVSDEERRVAAGGYLQVFPCIESEDWSQEEYLQDLPDNEESEHPVERYCRLEPIGTPEILDIWVHRRSQEWEQGAKQIPLRIGIFFFLAGFLLQIISNLISSPVYNGFPIC